MVRSGRAEGSPWVPCRNGTVCGSVSLGTSWVRGPPCARATSKRFTDIEMPVRTSRPSDKSLHHVVVRGSGLTAASVKTGQGSSDGIVVGVQGGGRCVVMSHVRHPYVVGSLGVGSARPPRIRSRSTRQSGVGPGAVPSLFGLQPHHTWSLATVRGAGASKKKPALLAICWSVRVFTEVPNGKHLTRLTTSGFHVF